MPRGVGVGVSPIPHVQRYMMLQCYLQDLSVEQTHDFVFLKQGSSVTIETVRRKFMDFARDGVDVTSKKKYSPNEGLE